MAKYRKKPVVIEAHKWEKNGDHPLDHDDFGNAVDSEIARDKYHDYLKTEGKLVRRYRNPIGDGNEFCQYCHNVMHIHGWIDTKEGGHIVCPGDMIITGVQGEHYPCKPDIFEQTYEPVT